MQQELLGLIAETSIHAGTGRATGVIDLPIMRESHTGWPCVFGSAVKGALRCKAEQTPHASSWVVDVFGPDTKYASDHAGALAVSDARLLLLPVRSLTSHFKWVTCPALIKRAADDARRMGKAIPALPTPGFKSDEALTAAHEGPLYLEEFQFLARKADLSALIAWLASYVREEGFEARLQQQLVIVSDDLFAHISQFATPVTPHIAINNETKTVKPGALWYEETLPPDTVLYLTLATSRTRRKGSDADATALMQKTLSIFPAERPYLQLGGNETTGMGWCRVARVEV